MRLRVAPRCDRDVARLRFVNRVRALDLPTADLAGLVELWDDEECAPGADELRQRLSERLADTQRRITELVALAGDLQQVLARLEHPPHDGPLDVGHDRLVLQVTGPAQAQPIITAVFGVAGEPAPTGRQDATPA